MTVEYLEQHGACPEQVSLFQKIWPNGCKVSLYNFRRAEKQEMNVSWLTCTLSSSAEAEYNKAVAPALAEYNKAVAPARAEYNKAVASALVSALNSEDAS